jgi:hypothetical protein
VALSAATAPPSGGKTPEFRKRLCRITTYVDSGSLRRPSGAKSRASVPRVPLRSTRGYSPLPLRGKKSVISHSVGRAEFSRPSGGRTYGVLGFRPRMGPRSVATGETRGGMAPNTVRPAPEGQPNASVAPPGRRFARVFHGFRFAPPVATARCPLGAKNHKRPSGHVYARPCWMIYSEAFES